ncbi:hypothetical protein [Klebsiella grimontii]|uniref:hypothetical protein n=1 Tax=Klebsiella grimontii TaxID=2058152 RepID=UPI002244F3D3|nr:hypothetical protein [Klebsiella grimontii]
MMTTFLPIAGTTGEAPSALRSELAAPSGRATGQAKKTRAYHKTGDALDSTGVC